MSDAESLRERAARCFFLAQRITDREVIAELQALGRELEAKAVEIECDGHDSGKPRIDSLATASKH